MLFLLKHVIVWNYRQLFVRHRELRRRKKKVIVLGGQGHFN